MAIETTERKSGFRMGWPLVIILVLLAAVVIMLTQEDGDDRREPSPTPTNENVHQIAP
jgi:hypothetical protein